MENDTLKEGVLKESIKDEVQNSVEKYFGKLKQQVEIRMCNIMYDNYGNETPEHEQFIHILNGLLKELKKGGE